MVLTLLLIAGAPIPSAVAVGPPVSDIIVTGELVKRTQRTMASSVRVVSARKIEATSADSVEQMLALLQRRRAIIRATTATV